MLKLKDPVQKKIRLLRGGEIEVEAEVCGNFLIHPKITSHGADYRYCAVTHEPSMATLGVFKNVGMGRKAVALTKSFPLNWDGTTYEEIIKVMPGDQFEPYRQQMCALRVE